MLSERETTAIPGRGPVSQRRHEGQDRPALDIAPRRERRLAVPKRTLQATTSNQECLLLESVPQATRSRRLKRLQKPGVEASGDGVVSSMGITNDRRMIVRR